MIMVPAVGVAVTTAIIEVPSKGLLLPSVIMSCHQEDPIDCNSNHTV
jgi:hypothetical protein